MVRLILFAIFIFLVFRRMSTHSSADINWDYLHDLSGNNASFEWEILTLFCEDTSIRLQQLQAALLIPDLAAAKALTHHLKGSASNLCLISIHTQAIAIETYLQQGHLDQAIALFPTLEQAFQDLQMAVSRLVSPST